MERFADLWRKNHVMQVQLHWLSGYDFCIKAYCENNNRYFLNDNRPFLKNIGYRFFEKFCGRN